MSELSPQQEKSIEDAVDKRGFSYDDARRAEGLEQPRDELQQGNTATPRGRASHPAYGRRRGGRSFNEPSDSELDSYWNVESASVSPQEQMEIYRRGIALARQALAETQREKDESDSMAAAKKRAREEKRRK